jgi:hypothetical protein
VFPIPIPPPASTSAVREPGPVRPSRLATVVLRTIFWLGALSLGATVLFFTLVALFFYNWQKSGEEYDRWAQARDRKIAADAEQPLRAAALDGTLTETEIAAVLSYPWTISRSSHEIRVNKPLSGTVCTVYTFPLPIGPQAQVKRTEVPSCNMDGATFHLRPTGTPTR